MPGRKSGEPRNARMSTGTVDKYGRSAMFAKKALYKKVGATKPAAVKEATPEFVEKKVGGDKNGGSRKVATKKTQRFYATADTAKAHPNRKSVRAPKVRSSIQPGTILILLAGRFKGKRVVCLKTTESGLCVVTGPFKVNGVPLRRVNPAYVIATQTSVEGVNAADYEKYNDDYFRRPASAKKVRNEEGFFAKKDKSGKSECSAERIADQQAVDTALMASIGKVANLEKYMHATFSLKQGQYPHLMQF